MKNLILAFILSLTAALPTLSQAQAPNPDLTKLSKDLEDLKKIVSLQQAQLQNSLGNQRICSGATLPGQGWVKYGTKGLTITIDTKSCGFKSSPKYFTNLNGNSGHWMTEGVTSIYNPTAQSFTVFIYFNFDNNDLLQFAQSTDYRIEWLAVGS